MSGKAAVISDHEAFPDIPSWVIDCGSSMIKENDARLDIQASPPDIRDAPLDVTARQIDDNADGIDVDEGFPEDKVEAIDEQAAMTKEHDALI